MRWSLSQLLSAGLLCLSVGAWWTLLAPVGTIEEHAVPTDCDEILRGALKSRSYYMEHWNHAWFGVGVFATRRYYHQTLAHLQNCTDMLAAELHEDVCPCATTRRRALKPPSRGGAPSSALWTSSAGSRSRSPNGASSHATRRARAPTSSRGGSRTSSSADSRAGSSTASKSRLTGTFNIITRRRSPPSARREGRPSPSSASRSAATSSRPRRGRGAPSTTSSPSGRSAPVGPSSPASSSALPSASSLRPPFTVDLFRSRRGKTDTDSGGAFVAFDNRTPG